MSRTIYRGALLFTAIAGTGACLNVLGDYDFSGKPSGTGGGTASSTGTGGHGGTGGTTTSSSSNSTGAPTTGSTVGSTGSTTSSATTTGSTTSSATTSSSGGTCDAGTHCSGGCVNLQSDSANCGACGHSCISGACVTGACRAWTVASRVTRPVSIDADGAYVVWSDGTNVYQHTRTAGGSTITVTPPQALLPAMAGTGPSLRNGTVAFVGAGGVYTVPEGMSSATKQASLDTATYSYSSVTLDPMGTIAYVLAQTTAGPPYQNWVLKCPLTGGSCSRLGTAPSSNPPVSGAYTVQIVANSTYAFWLYTGAPSAQVNRLTFANQALDTFPSGTGGLAIDAVNVYWVGSSAGWPVNGVSQASFSSTSTPWTVTAAGAVGMLNGEPITSDGTNVYVASPSNSANPGSIYAIPAHGGTPTPIYSSPYAGGAAEGPVVTAGSAVYWVEGDLTASPAVYYIMGLALP